MKENQKGLALFTVLILSIVAIMLIGTLIYFLLRGKESQVLQSRYTSSLEVAKGASEILMQMITDPYNPDLPFNCSDTELNAYNNVNCAANCSPISNSYICLRNYKCLGSSGPATCNNGYRITARLLAYKKLPTGEEVYTLEIRSVFSNNSAEKSVVQFVYKVGE